MRTGDATSNHLFEIARILQRQGVRVQVFSNWQPGPLPDDIRPLVRQIEANQYQPQSDLVLVEYPGWCPLAERIRDARGVTIFSYQGITPPSLWGNGEGQEHLQLSETRSQLAWYSHLATAASAYTAEELHRHSGYPQERIQVLPYSVPVDAFRNRPSQEKLDQLRAQWHLQGKRVVFFIGRIAGNKRVDLAIGAFARLADLDPALHLLIVGDTDGNATARDLTAKLRQQVNTLGLDGRVTFTGHTDSAPVFFHIAEVLLLPSLHEGFGVPLIEAMAAQVPVIASASGSMPWVLNTANGEEQAAGLLHTPSDAEDLARQLRRVLTDPDLRAGLVARGQARVDDFTPAQFEKNVLAVINDAIERAKEPPPAAHHQVSALYNQADVALRNYKIRSGAPVVGRLIEWVRKNSTSHVKEPYLDRIIERQVSYNMALVNELERMRLEISRLKTEVEALRRDRSA